ncbi:MAG TPA: hypothetical protein VK446_11735 [Methylocystis sp.]|nr:hypothetical protein [Methylocystis sp.]
MKFPRLAFSALFLGLSAGSAHAADDGSVFNALSGVFGYGDSQGEKIDFRERPKIVLPPNREALPEPRAADHRPSSWPVDSRGSTRGGPRVVSSAQGLSAGDPKRENLTQPPDGYRHPTKDMSNWTDPEAKKGFNPLSYVSGLGKNLGFGE